MFKFINNIYLKKCILLFELYNRKKNLERIFRGAEKGLTKKLENGMNIVPNI